jgi:hypothetical protein
MLRTDGTPLDTAFYLRNLTGIPADSVSSNNTIEPDHSGKFIFPAESWSEYELSFIGSPPASGYQQVAKMELAEGASTDLGNVLVRFPPRGTPTASFAGPFRISADAGTAIGRQIGGLFISDGSATVIHDNGEVIQVPSEKEQVGFSSLLIAPDQQATGWLVDSKFCCTSYPIDLVLVVYRAGKPLQRFTGDGRPIFKWFFVNGGTQVAFYQDFLHGTSAAHYELRNVDSGRLIDKWDGELTMQAPNWTNRFKP